MRLQAKLVDIRHEFKLELGELAHHIHGGIAARNGVRQYSTHTGARLVMLVVRAMAATIQTRIVGIDTCRWPNLSTSLPSSGLETASAIAWMAVSTPASE